MPSCRCDVLKYDLLYENYIKKAGNFFPVGGFRYLKSACRIDALHKSSHQPGH